MASPAGVLRASLAVVIAVTATYHLGFARCREDGVSQPETGNLMISLPMLLSTNPIGSVLDRAAMHVSVVANDYETTTVRLRRRPRPADPDLRHLQHGRGRRRGRRRATTSRQLGVGRAGARAASRTSKRDPDLAGELDVLAPGAGTKRTGSPGARLARPCP